ncbi:MAG TPA: hypothetical protein VIQ05_19360 [Tardiphaga sp.]
MQLPSITIMGEEDPIEISFAAVAAYHGQGALAMLAITFQAIRLALEALSPNTPPKRADITVVSGHPGPGVRDSFEFATRAVTRGAYTIDRSLPLARFVTGADISYSFHVMLAGRTAEIALRPTTLPERFFELTFSRTRAPSEEAELRQLRKSIAANVLAAVPADLFELSVS